MSGNPSSQLSQIRPDLDKVEAVLQATVASANPYLNDVASHLIGAGGKRLRPILTIASAGVTQNQKSGNSQESENSFSESVYKAAAATELTHLGSLHHDDVIDGAQQRRNVESVNARFGNAMAILSGDYMLAKASSLVAHLGGDTPEVLASTIAELVMGQVLEWQDLHNLQRSVESYEESINGKTASLLAASAHLGANAVEARPEDAAAVEKFGRAFGMAFQIRDDLHDVLSTAEEMGKPVGNDLLEGTYSLPTIYALQDSAVSDELSSLLTKDMTADAVLHARKLIAGSLSIERTRERCNYWVEQAADAVTGFNDSKYLNVLHGLLATVR